MSFASGKCLELALVTSTHFLSSPLCIKRECRALLCQKESFPNTPESFSAQIPQYLMGNLSRAGPEAESQRGPEAKVGRAIDWTHTFAEAAVWLHSTYTNVSGFYMYTSPQPSSRQARNTSSSMTHFGQGKTPEACREGWGGS